MQRRLARNGGGRGESARTDRYLDKAVKHLSSLSCNAARRAVLTEKIEEWETAYLRFQQTEGQSHPNASAADFVTTIAGLQRLHRQYQDREVA